MVRKLEVNEITCILKTYTQNYKNEVTPKLHVKGLLIPTTRSKVHER